MWQRISRLEALAQVIRSNRWKLMSLTLQQAEVFEKELNALGFVIVEKPAQK